MLSNAVVMQHFDYASSVWSRLQVLRIKLTRTILSAPDIRTPIDNLLSFINWTRLCKRWSYHMLILIYKCLENMCPDYLCNQFNFVHKVHNHINKKAYYTNELM